MFLADVRLVFQYLCGYAETKCGELAWLELEGMDAVAWKRLF